VSTPRGFELWYGGFVRDAPRADVWLAGGSTFAAGAGLAVAAFAASVGSMALAAVCGGIAASGLVLLVAAGWIDGLIVVALAIPLPALVSTADLRVAAAAPLTAAVVLGWLMGNRPLGPAIRLRHVQILTLCLLASFALSAAFASSFITSIRELVNMLALFVFFLLALGLARAAGAAERVTTAVIALAAICGALGVLEMLGVLPGQFPRWGTPFNRAALGFGQPNGLGLFLAVSVPLAVHALRSNRGAARALAACALLATAAGLFATFSRGAWLAVLGGATALVLVRDTRTLIRFLMGVIVFGILIDAVSGGMLRDTAQRTLTDWVLEQRAALMVAGVLMFAAHPVAGVGPGGFAVELDSYGAQVPELWDYLATPHNAYVQMAAEGGLIGLAVFIAFLGVCFVVLVRRANEAVRAGESARELSLRRSLLWSFATACCAGMVVWPFAHGTGQAVLLLLALGLARETL